MSAKENGIGSTAWIFLLFLVLVAEGKSLKNSLKTWESPCDSPGGNTIDDTWWETQAQRFTLADQYRQVFENAIVLRNRVQQLTEAYAHQHIQDTTVVDMLRSFNDPDCVLSLKDPVHISFEKDPGLLVDKASNATITAFTKMATFVSYFEVVSDKYRQDGGGFVAEMENEKLAEVTDNTYRVLCDLHNVLKRLRMLRNPLPVSSVDDVTSAQRCLAGLTYNQFLRYTRDFIFLNNFRLLVAEVARTFEDLYTEATPIVEQ